MFYIQNCSTFFEGTNNIFFGEFSYKNRNNLSLKKRLDKNVMAQQTETFLSVQSLQLDLS